MYPKNALLENGDGEKTNYPIGFFRLFNIMGRSSAGLFRKKKPKTEEFDRDQNMNRSKFR